jgi:hypothetical protein
LRWVIPGLGKETGHILNIKYSEKYRFEKKLWDRYKRPEEKGRGTRDDGRFDDGRRDEGRREGIED